MSNKRKYTKCECCPFYAKEKESKKWECSKINRAYYDVNTYIHYEKAGICIFNQYTSKSEDNELRNQILERWIKANE